jgi:hypothetical protein
MTTLTFARVVQSIADTKINVSNTHAAFNTNRKGADSVSAPTVLMAVHYDKNTKTIRVMSEDGKVRECRVDRLINVDAGRALWTKLASKGKEGSEVTFVAAGGFSADRWFYDVK